MSGPDVKTYHLTVCSTELRWNGDLSIPAHRRLADFLNDRNSSFLVLEEVSIARWDNSMFKDFSRNDSIALIKHNIIAVIENSDVTPFSQRRNPERVQKVSMSTIIYAPPLVLAGDLHIVSGVKRLDALSAMRLDFFPITNVDLWYFKTGTRLNTGLNLALVQLEKAIGLEAKGQALNGGASHETW